MIFTLAVARREGRSNEAEQRRSFLSYFVCVLFVIRVFDFLVRCLPHFCTPARAAGNPTHSAHEEQRLASRLAPRGVLHTGARKTETRVSPRAAESPAHLAHEKQRLTSRLAPREILRTRHTKSRDSRLASRRGKSCAPARAGWNSAFKVTRSLAQSDGKTTLAKRGGTVENAFCPPLLSTTVYPFRREKSRYLSLFSLDYPFPRSLLAVLGQ